MANKLKMSQFKFRCILIPIMAFIVVFAVTATVLMNYFGPSLDTYLGRGEKIIDGGGLYSDEQTMYYDQPYEKSQDGKVKASYAGAEISEEISDEGEVLLKNDGTLPLEKNTKVTPMGFRYVTPVMTGTGSGAATLLQKFVVKPTDALHTYFDVNETMEKVLKNADAVYATAKGYKGKSDENGTFAGATASVGEFKPSVYKSSDVGTYKTAIVFIGRQGGEGGDLQMTPYYDNDGTKIAEHQLQLMPYEKQMLEFAKTNCDKVIVIVNSPNRIELGELQADEGINAVLWVGTTGCSGFESMGKILCGEVNPSGKLVDTYYSDFKADPTYVNYGDFGYTNCDANFVEYEEGIYVGYKYYETKYTDEAEYAEAVVYPFGYGMNYEDEKITQSLDSVSYDSETGDVTVKGTVTNNSSREVKEVVQIYFEPPYYKDGSGIEKAKKNLVAFDKITVAAGKSETFEMVFAAEDMASYDYKGYYTQGKGSYVLEKGDYIIHLGKDAHNSWESEKLTFDASIVYFDDAELKAPTIGCKYVGKRASDEVTATNLYSYINEYMDNTGDYGSGIMNNLTRADDLSSYATAPVNKSASNAVIAQFNNTKAGTIDYSSFWIERFGTDAPVSGEDNNLSLSELRGASYDDPIWDKLLNQIDFNDADVIKQINSMLGYGAFNTGALDCIGKVKTNESDGPQAIGKTGISDGTGAACAYPSEVVIASTWNTELAEKMGVAIGDEALAQNSNGWYAPACNIHRSPFLGRTYEYYSEDAVLSGYMAMYTVQGAASKGYTAYIKHFAVNEQDTNRSFLCTWLTEQAMREIYLKPFEIAVKYGKITEKYLAFNETTGMYETSTVTRKAATAMMTSMNCIGGTWVALDYSLCTNLLRDEWGFKGVVITDSVTPENNQFNNALAAGNDYYLNFMRTSLNDTSSALAQWTIRTAIKNVCYAVVNGNAMQGIGPRQSYHFAMSPWAVGLLIGDIVCGVSVVLGAIWIVLRANDEKKYPDKYAKRNTSVNN